MIGEMGVELKGEVEVQYRSGGRKTEAIGLKGEGRRRPRDDLPKREKLARSDQWKKVFIALDMTNEQQAEERKQKWKGGETQKNERRKQKRTERWGSSW